MNSRATPPNRYNLHVPVTERGGHGITIAQMDRPFELGVRLLRVAAALRAYAAPIACEVILTSATLPRPNTFRPELREDKRRQTTRDDEPPGRPCQGPRSTETPSQDAWHGYKGIQEGRYRGKPSRRPPHAKKRWDRNGRRERLGDLLLQGGTAESPAFVGCYSNLDRQEETGHPNQQASTEADVSDAQQKGRRTDGMKRFDEQCPRIGVENKKGQSDCDRNGNEFVRWEPDIS